MGNAGKLTAEELRAYVADNIERAIEKDFIRVFYQPVVRTLTGEVCGVEALARWDDPDYGLLSPDIFIGALEEARKIHLLDGCIIRKICEDYQGDLPANEHFITVSFNLSRLDFQLCDIHALIEEEIEKNDVPRDALRIEITESMMENNEGRMHDVIDRFWERGLRVWMDDFGSGFSSLNVLKDYRFDTLKIDMIFLRNFDVRSQEIVKSIVDMAKRIGIHTLAEGVETKEQLDFLRNIGCEKAQGYYIGKPAPYGDMLRNLKEKGFSLESPAKRHYYHEIGRVNILSATPMLAVQDNAVEPTYREQQAPLAIVELSRNKIKYLFANESYRNTLQSVGVSSVEEVEADFGRGETSFGEKFLAMMKKADKTNDVVGLHFVRGKSFCYAQVRKIAGYRGGKAYLCILQNLSSAEGMSRNERLSEYLQSLYSIYERIELVDLETGRSENLYSSSLTKENYNVRPAAEELKTYAEQEIYPEDRLRFLEFSDLDTVEKRIDASLSSFISEPFRTKMSGGGYVWELYSYFYAGGKADRKVLSCARRLETTTVAYMYADIENQAIASEHTAREQGITAELLWRNFKMSADTAYFWKDKERRFLGANNTFLRYFGLSSEAELIGKRGEDLSWHLNPKTYIEGEERILETGEQTYLVPSKLIKKGDLRDAVSSKTPIYKDGEIVGLMGYFLDMTDWKRQNKAIEQLSLVDTQTGMLNFLGVIEAGLRYQESYAFEGIDFILMYINISKFKDFNSCYGIEWTNLLLKEFADRLRNVVGDTGIAGRLHSDRFLILKQCAGDKKQVIEELLARIKQEISGIREVDGIPCTVYYRVGYSFFSETEEMQSLIMGALDKEKESRSARGAS